MGFLRQEYWSGLPFPSPGDRPNPGIELMSPALAGGVFTATSPGKPRNYSRTSLMPLVSNAESIKCHFPSQISINLSLLFLWSPGNRGKSPVLSQDSKLTRSFLYTCHYTRIVQKIILVSLHLGVFHWERQAELVFDWGRHMTGR